MRNIILSVAILIAIYTLQRYNLFMIDDQLVFSTTNDIFYDTFIPILILIGSIAALLNKGKFNILVIVFLALFADAIHRLSNFINQFYIYLFSDAPIQIEVRQESVHVVEYLWPSYILVAIEILLIFAAIIYLKQTIRMEGNS